MALGALIGATFGFGVLSQYMSIKNQQDARKDIKEAQQMVNAKADEDARRSRLRAIKQQRITRAESVNQAANIGALQSSGIQGGTSAQASQVAGNIGGQLLSQGVQQGVIGKQQDAQKSSTKAGLWQSLADASFGIGMGGLQQSVFDIKSKSDAGN